MIAFRLAKPALVAALATSLVSSVAAQVYHTVDDAQRDPAVSNLDDSFLSIPGLFSDYVRSGGGNFVELPDGTARLTGRVFALSSLYSAFLFDITFTGRVAPGDASYPPVGGPDERLLSSAYTPVGSVDSAQFVYYTGATGTLTGVRNNDGDVLSVTASAPVQVGVGANNHNTNVGVQAQFSVSVLQGSLAPLGTAELTFDLTASSDESATHPQVYDPSLTNLTDGRAMVLPGVADDYVFVPSGSFREYDDGTAALDGTFARLVDLDDAWDATLTMSGRVDPGQVNHPPVGSPVLQMLPTAYVSGGGFMDPSSWHYYTNVTGTLIGVGINDGGQLSLVADGATQVGGGANQTNTYMGYYGNYDVTVDLQPTGRTLNVTGDCELFGLTAVFPVLPFPDLTPPVSTPTLPTLTDQGVVLEGNNLAWVELAFLGFDVLGPGTATDWYDGYFRVIDNTHVEVHPRPGKQADLYNIVFYNPAIQTNTLQIDLQEPTTPALYAEPSVGANETVHVLMHSGDDVGPTVSLVVLSQLLGASSAPGIVDLEIGMNFTDVMLDPGAFTHDPVTGIAQANYGPIPAGLLGSFFYFEAAILDVGNPTFPFPTTNYYRVDFL